MLPAQEALVAEMLEQFKTACQQVDEEAFDLWKTKGSIYDQESWIGDRIPFGELSLCHEIFRTAFRLAEMMKTIDPDDVEFETIDEKLLDLLNYTKAWAAYRKMAKAQEEEE